MTQTLLALLSARISHQKIRNIAMATNGIINPAFDETEKDGETPVEDTNKNNDDERTGEDGDKAASAKIPPATLRPAEPELNLGTSSSDDMDTEAVSINFVFENFMTFCSQSMNRIAFSFCLFFTEKNIQL